jgi:DNA repair protein RecN (Recombination protein N)
MLTRLKIQNLVLVDRADISFGSGLNILTGETGAGKSAILTAIRLIAGERADTQLIGKNGEIAIVEAYLLSYSLTEEISPPPFGEPLCVRREIHRSGKSRCFVEEEQISLSLLRQIAGSSIELVDPASSQLLCLREEQRNMLDAFAGLSHDAKVFAGSFVDEQTEAKKLEEILGLQEQRGRDLSWAREDLAAIEEVNWQEEEEAQLTRDHQLLTHAQELLEKIGNASDALSDRSLKRASHLLDSCVRCDATLTSLAASLRNALLEIEEVDHQLRTYLGRLEADPNRLTHVENRIGAIEQMKKRFGKTVAEVGAKKKELLARIDRLLHLEEEVTSLRTSLQSLREKNLLLSQSLSAKRQETAALYASLILAELKTLNLPHARFEISLQPMPLTSHGSDEIRFLFSANPGQPPIPLEECASSGEISRLLLAIKTVLSEKDKSACLIFDEIDSNVGGQTAAILGEKLKKIAEKKQVICVTHFVQVAKAALHHFAVSKGEQKGRAVTTISKLSESQRGQEYQRMLGSN